MDRLSDYDYHLPPERIAAHPAAERDAARLLVMRRAARTIEHFSIRDLPDLLNAGDLLVLNDTRVIPARLRGRREATGGRWEGLFLSANAEGRWRLLSQSRGRLIEGESVVALPEPSSAVSSSDALRLTLVARESDGVFVFRPESVAPHLELLDRFGTTPLPPYIERDEPTGDDRDRYQTTYARNPGSVAAPTAGLHFTPELLARCRAAGVETATVTLHVGVGTFRPVAVDDLSRHVMHSEWCDLPAETAAAVNAARRRGGRVVAVGTTSVRTLESAALAAPPDDLRPHRGDTRLFIRPPWTFRAVDAMLTNFHLPRSTLLMLVSAFAGREFVLDAYRAAVDRQYRFFSYGDAMLIL